MTLSVVIRRPRALENVTDAYTEAEHPVEIAYFDRGPIDPNMLVLGGDWSVYWYNGHIYASEIARGLDVFELTPTQFLTQNEIHAAKAVQVAERAEPAKDRVAAKVGGGKGIHRSAGAVASASGG